jgi:hypothetical protein
MNKEIIFTEREVIDLVVALRESLNTDSASSVKCVEEVISDLRKKFNESKESDPVPVEIIINGKVHIVRSSKIPYEDVMAFAGYSYNSVVTTTWGKGNNHGVLLPGESVPVSQGMVFNAFITGNA